MKNFNTKISCLLLGTVLLSSCKFSKKNQPVITGEFKLWHTITMEFNGPETSETNEQNPFLDYKMDVTFTNGDYQIIIPGFYVADGNAAETSADSGNIWMVRFTPDTEGTWHWQVSFIKGKNIAVEEDAESKKVFFDGVKGSFNINATNKTGKDFRANGILKYDNSGYLKFSGSKKFWLKNGTDSPETFLAYHDFDGTYDLGGTELPALDNGLHHYYPHKNDWTEKDTTWQNGKGKGIIGAINYLASKNVNSHYFIVMNVLADGQDVWPWIAPDSINRFDVSKLEQWEIVFQHMQSKGILLHLLTQETENDTLLNHGNLGPERKLFYRELIARFAHHPGLIWNLGEETNRSTEQLKSYASYIRSLDPYNHMICVHPHVRMEQDGQIINRQDLLYTPLLGFENLDGISLQISDINYIHNDVLKWVNKSEEAGQKWIVNLDEIGPWSDGVLPDKTAKNHPELRHKALWATLMAGGAGVEWYFGWDNNGPDSDLSAENYRSRDIWWDYSAFANSFFLENLPYWEMKNTNDLVDQKKAFCFSKVNEIYAIYLPEVENCNLLLESDEEFQVFWYNPREGGNLLKGNVLKIKSKGWHNLGFPPYEKEEDWVILVKK